MVDTQATQQALADQDGVNIKKKKVCLDSRDCGVGTSIKMLMDWVKKCIRFERSSCCLFVQTNVALVVLRTFMLLLVASLYI